MGRKLIECSNLEKIALYYEVVTGRLDYREAYKLVKNLPEDAVIDDMQNSNYYNWVKCTRVQAYIKFVRADLKAREEKMRTDIKKAIKKEEDFERFDVSGIDGAVNFRNREETISWLNKQVNLCTDEKQKYDYLKMLSDLQSFKDKDNKDKVQEVQRFYTPLLCRECELYRRRAKQIGHEIEDEEEIADVEEIDSV